MAEFALTVPILLILFIGVADFGRIFATGVALEAAARDAAEVGAQQYIADASQPGPGPGPLNAASTGTSAYYAALDAKTAKVACAESGQLPNADLASDETCATWPVIRVCVHDGVDPMCGQPVSGFSGAMPAECAGMQAAWSNSQNGSVERWVEVRVCYKFTSLLRVPLLSFGDYYLERNRQFVIPCYFVLGAAPCG